MKYHAKLTYGAGKIQIYFNWGKDGIVEKLLIPFVNGQVVFLTRRKTILNLKNVSELNLYRTEQELTAGSETISSQILKEEFEKFDCTEEIINETKILFSSNKSTSLLEKTLAKEINQVFVIMKFGDSELDSAYEGVIKPVFAEFKINVIRVDEIQNSGKISDQILQSIASSRFIFSELTGERPNCYYETGFAHALGKEIILSIHSKSKIHFDLAGHRFIEWHTENDLRKQLRVRIKSLLET